MKPRTQDQSPGKSPAVQSVGDARNNNIRSGRNATRRVDDRPSSPQTSLPVRGSSDAQIESNVARQQSSPGIATGRDILPMPSPRSTSTDGTSSSRSSLDPSENVKEIRKGAKLAVRPKSEGNKAASAAAPSSKLNTDATKPRQRPRNAWACSPMTLLATLLSGLLGFIIFRSFSTRQLDPDGCSMSYMWPAFAKMSDFGTEYTRFASKYSLYLYREGGVDEDARVKGVPVLFIPGNAGSYKQVRPLAAEAATYYQQTLEQDMQARNDGKRPLDFFTVDFNEDITAFHGQTLLDQAEYLNEAISYILSLYHEPGRFLRDRVLPDPTSVIIVGHSMGGIVARTMLTLHNYQDSSINTILTLAAPHARPPVSFDAEIVRTYQRINDYWRDMYSKQWASDNKLWHVTLVSISGGGLDTVVPSDYSTLASLVPPTHGFTVFTSTIPEVWTGMDHLAITWCNQLRQAVIRSIYDVIDANRSSQTRPRAERMTAFKKRFLTGLEDVAEQTLLHRQHDTLLTLEDDSNLIVPQGDRLVIRELGRAGRAKPYLMPIPPPSQEAKVFTLLTDHRFSRTDALEVLFCSVASLHASHPTDVTTNLDLSEGAASTAKMICKSAAGDAIMLPSSRKENHRPFDNYLNKDWNVLVGRTPPFSYLQYNFDALSEHQFVAVIDKAPHPMPGWVLAEFSAKADTVIQTDHSLSTMITKGLDVSASDRTMMTEVKIPSVFSSLLAYRVDVVKPSCGAADLFQPLLRQYIAEPYESKWFVNAKKVDVSMHGIAPYMPPPLKANSERKGLTLQIWTDPTCGSKLDISMKVDLLGSVGKLWMRYRTAFAAFPLLVVALVLRKQFQVYDQSGSFISFSESMDLCLRTSIPVLLLALTLWGVSFQRVSSPWSAFGGLFGTSNNGSTSTIDFSSNDLLLGSQDPFFSFLVPLFGLIVVGICVVLNFLVLAITQILTSTLSLLTRTFVSKETDRSNATLAVTPVRRRIIITCVLLLLTSTVIPYQFIFIVLCVVQLATCIRALSLAQDTLSAANFHFHNYAHSMLMLMLWILPINIPTLVVWVHNIAVHWLTPFSSHHNVLSIMPYILLIETMSTGHMIPSCTKWIRHLTSGFLFILAGVAAVYGVTFAYLLHHFVNVLCAWLFVLHVSAAGLDSGRLMRLLDGLVGGERKPPRKKQP